MSVSRSIYVLMLFLTAGLLAAASPAAAERAGNYNDAQLKLLFSGTEVAGEGSCQLMYPGVLTLDFTFHKDGKFFVDYTCTPTAAGGDAGNTTGTWSIEENELCILFKYPGMGWKNVIEGNCYSVRHDRSGFGFYSRAGRFLELTFKHPKFPTKEKLLAALGELASGTGAVASTKTEKTPKIKTTAFSNFAPAAEGPALPPAEYKPLPVGTDIKYNNRSFKVIRSEGFTTVYKKIGGLSGYQSSHALFGDYSDNLHVVYSQGTPITYDISREERQKLEKFWPLKIGKRVEYQLNEGSEYKVPADDWKISLKVLRAEAVRLNGYEYATYVIEEQGESGFEKSYIGHKWYHPGSGLVLKSKRKWLKSNVISSDHASKTPHFDEGEEDNYEMVRVTFPKGTTTHALKGTRISEEAQTAKATTLPPAPYKAPLVGTKIKYDDRIYRVTRTDGYLTVYRSITEGNLSYLNAYALFGEYADNLYVTHNFGFEIPYKIDTDNRKKLEAFWPLEAGKKTKFEVVEEDAGTIPLRTSDGQSWVIALEVAKAEAISLNGKNYSTYVIVEEAKSGDGFSFVGRKWYHPTSGLIVKAERTWTKIVSGQLKIPNFAEGDEDNYTLVRVRFPEGTIAVAAKQEPKAPPAVSTAEIARLERETEEKRKARAAEIARLEREAEEKRQASARKAEAEQKARTAELARLEREAEEKRLAAARKAEAEQKAREAEVARLAREEEKAREAEEKAGTAAQKEIARLKREAVEAKKASLAEVARLKREAAEARDAEVARLRQQLEEALKGRKIVEAPKAKAKAADGLAGIKFGNYHALIIGINNYKNLPKLTTAINDAKGVAKVLKDEYGFKVTTLIDPDRLDIIDAFDELKETLTDEDNLLIYYAGHGWLDEDTDRGYWLPVDAKPKRRSRWVSNATITDTLKGLSAKHVLVLADSCYSGTLTRAADVGTRKRKGDYWKKMASKWARVAITSGGLEPVADKGGGKNSPFAKAFIDVLRDNVSIMDGVQLFGKMRRPVMVAAEQTPQYSDVRNAGHDGGDFLFVRKK